jgi:hypothetical protein
MIFLVNDLCIYTTWVRKSAESRKCNIDVMALPQQLEDNTQSIGECCGETSKYEKE